MASKHADIKRRAVRVRRSLKKVAGNRARLSVHRSSQHIYAQVIDDANGNTVASASTMETELRSKIKNGGNVDAATQIGKIVAERAVKAGVKEVVFDRGAFIYHGRVKALADAAREGGLSF